MTSAVRRIAQRVGTWLTGKGQKQSGRRMYASARNTRSTAGLAAASNTSADAELLTSLAALRARSRQMVRDSSYAKRAKQIVVNNIIGAGVGLQAQVANTRQALNERVNADIEAAWEEWCSADSCHTGGALHFSDFERAAMGQVFEAGEVFVRLHRRPFGKSRVPLSLELVEPERLSDGIVEPGSTNTRNEIRMGIEVDEFGRPVAYWIKPRHPGDVRLRGPGPLDAYERVLAADVLHLRVVDRWPQTRGEPWLHTAVTKLDNLNEYSSLEVQAARAGAAYFATITTPDPDSASLPTDDSEGDKPVMDLEPLTIQELAPGEELTFHTPNRPNVALDPFMRAMLREVSAGACASYESLSRDYSQSNYSSSRLALIDDRELYRALQQWFIRSFRRPLHAVWMFQAVLSRAVSTIPIDSYALDPAKFEAARFKPRGWSWIDPTKEVNAYKEAVKAGFMTVTDVIALTGNGVDIEDVVATRKRELEMFDAADIHVDTTVEEPAMAGASSDPSTPTTTPDPMDGEGDTPDAAPARVVPMRGRA